MYGVPPPKGSGKGAKGPPPPPSKGSKGGGKTSMPPPAAPVKGKGPEKGSGGKGQTQTRPRSSGAPDKYHLEIMKMIFWKHVNRMLQNCEINSYNFS